MPKFSDKAYWGICQASPFLCTSKTGQLCSPWHLGAWRAHRRMRVRLIQLQQRSHHTQHNRAGPWSICWSWLCWPVRSKYAQQLLLLGQAIKVRSCVSSCQLIVNWSIEVPVIVKSNHIQFVALSHQRTSMGRDDSGALFTKRRLCPCGFFWEVSTTRLKEDSELVSAGHRSEHGLLFWSGAPVEIRYESAELERELTVDSLMGRNLKLSYGLLETRLSRRWASAADWATILQKSYFREIWW